MYFSYVYGGSLYPTNSPSENNYKIRGKNGIWRQPVLKKPKYQKEKKQTEVTPKFSTAYFLQDFKWFNSEGIEISDLEFECLVRLWREKL